MERINCIVYIVILRIKKWKDSTKILTRMQRIIREIYKNMKETKIKT